MPADSPSAVTSPGRKLWLITALCFIVSALEGYDLQVIAAAAPFLEKDLNLSPNELGLFFGSSQIGLAIGAVLGALLANRYGRKHVLVGSVFLLGLFTFATALATNATMLITMRALAGFALGGAMPTVIALLAELWGRARMTGVITAMLCCQPIGGILSGVAGRTLGVSHGWESLFIVGGALTMIAAPILALMLPGARRDSQAEAGQPTAMPVPRALFGDGRSASTVIMWFLFAITLGLLSTVISWTPLIVIAQGLPRSVGINSIILLNIGSMVAGIIVGRLIDRFGARWPMTVLYAGMVISLFALPNLQTETGLMVTAVFLGATVLGAQFALYGILPRLYPAEGRTSGVGITLSIARVGGMVGPLGFGALIGAGMGVIDATRLLAPVGLVAGILLFALSITARESLRGESHA